MTPNAHLNAKIDELRGKREDLMSSRGNLEETQEYIDALLCSTAWGRELVQKRDAQLILKNSFKTEETEIAGNIREEVTAIAVATLEKGKSPFGRDIHPNVNVVRQSSMLVDQSRIAEIATWMIMQGKAEWVSLKTKGNLKFYQALETVLPSGLSIEISPGVRIDSKL